MNNNHIEISPDCSIAIENKNYYLGGPFQPLLRARTKEGEIEKFFKTNFNIDLRNQKSYYENINKPNACNYTVGHIITSEDKLIIIEAGTLFHQYTRTFTSITYAPDRSLVDLNGLKPSALPFSLKDFFMKCKGNMKALKGIPQPTDKCGPTYYPYVSTRRSTDWLSKLVGSYEYQENKVSFA